MLVNKEKGEFK